MLLTFPSTTPSAPLDAPWEHPPEWVAARWDACRAPLLSWFATQARDLPWRAPYAPCKGALARAEDRDHARAPRLPTVPHRSPYAVWVAEIMLQQTVVAAVIPHFQRWMRTFPDVRALAEASPDEVLRAWAGLGYYARARNLHKGAQRVVEGGVWPVEASAWREVPGVGEYTAGAVASLAFGRRAPLLDGNIVRVFSRLQGLRFLPGAGARARSLYWDLARLWVGARDGRAQAGEAAGAVGPAPGASSSGVARTVTADPGALNESLMELGALVCVPAAPRCGQCPLEAFCAARARGWTSVLPPAKPRAKIVRVKAVAVLAQAGGDTPSGSPVLLETRPRGAFLAGHLMFPLFLGDEATGWREAFLRRYPGWRFDGREDGPPEPAAALHHTIMSTRYDVEVYRAAVRPVPRAPHAARFSPPDSGSLSSSPSSAPPTWIPGHEVEAALSNALARKIWKAGGGD